MRLKLPTLSTLLLALSMGFAGSMSLAEETKTPKVLLIGIDGLRTDALKATNTPNLNALVKQGALAENTQIFSAEFQRNDTVSGPAAAEGKIDDPTSIVDVVPTIFTHLRVPIADEWKLDGRAIGLKPSPTK